MIAVNFDNFSCSLNNTLIKKRFEKIVTIGSCIRIMLLAIVMLFQSVSELYCKVCDQYFSSMHNRKEHMFGKTHLTNVSSEYTLNMDVIQKELKFYAVIQIPQSYDKDTYKPFKLPLLCSFLIGDLTEKYLKK